MSNIKSYKSLSTDKGFSLSTNTKGFKQFFSEDGNGDRISTHGSNLEAYQLQLFSRIFVNFSSSVKKKVKKYLSKNKTVKKKVRVELKSMKFHFEKKGEGCSVKAQSNQH